jgi:hypothetical protein
MIMIGADLFLQLTVFFERCGSLRHEAAVAPNRQRARLSTSFSKLRDKRLADLERSCQVAHKGTKELVTSNGGCSFDESS